MGARVSSAHSPRHGAHRAVQSYLPDPAEALLAAPGRVGRLERVGSAVFAVLLAMRQCLLAGLVGMLLLAVAPILLGWSTTVVVSGSMSPRIRPGDVIATAPLPGSSTARVALGTIVLVNNPARPGQLLLHRLVAYDPTGRMILKGDANATRDSTPVPVGDLRGLARMRVPAIGLPFLWVQQRQYLPAGAAAAILLVLMFSRPLPTVTGKPAAHRRTGG